MALFLEHQLMIFKLSVSSLVLVPSQCGKVDDDDDDDDDDAANRS